MHNYGEGPDNVAEALSEMWDILWYHGWTYDESTIHINTLVLKNVHCGYEYMNVWTPSIYLPWEMHGARIKLVGRSQLGVQRWKR